MTAENTNATAEPDAIKAAESESLVGQVRRWIGAYAAYWATSFTFHMVLLSVALLCFGTRVLARRAADDDIVLQSAETPVEKEAEPEFDFSKSDDDMPPDELTDVTRFDSPAQTAVYIDPSDEFVPPGGGAASVGNPDDLGGGGIAAIGPLDGPLHDANGGISPGGAIGKSSGVGGGPGGNGEYGGRGSHPGRDGSTKAGNVAIIAALYWLSRHQMPDGSWSLKGYAKQCKDGSCTGPGSEESLTAGTALGLLPFLAFGQTTAQGHYQPNVARGVYWLIEHQKADGDLYYVAPGQAAQPHDWMYSHGLAAIALCECYGMTNDKNIGHHAQLAIDFIIKAQNQKTGGWRYSPGDEGDTSVLGWQLMALKSAQMAGLKVDPAALDGTKRWLASVQAPIGAGGADAGASYGVVQFSYQPGAAPSATMTAVAVLCHQYLHAGRGDPVIVGGVKTLLENLPDEHGNRNLYYWYYATQVMHNMANHDWDTWNRRMRKILISSQNHEGCATGSWDPDKPDRDAWGQYGGRVMMTSLACLTLEVHCRYMPLFKVDRPEDAVGNKGAGDNRTGDRGAEGKAAGKGA